MSRTLAARLLDALPVALAALVTGRVLVAMWQRWSYRWDLEWMEGGMLSHAWRLQRGLPLYDPPTAEFIPFIYPPGYSALLAAAGGLFGLDYPTGRALSIAGTLLAALAIVFVVARHTRSHVASWVGAACFLGCFRASGGFYDLVRPDAVALGLAAWSIALAVERRRGAEVASGLLLAAAFLFKHNLAAFGLPIALALWIGRGRRAALMFVLSSAGPAGAMTLLLQWRSGGRMLTYLLGVPGTHPMLWERMLVGTPGELAVWLLPAVLAGAAVLVAVQRPASWVAFGVAGATLLGAWVGSRSSPVRGIPMGPPWAVGLMMAGLGAAVFSMAPRLARASRGQGTGSDRWWLAFGVGGTALVISGLMRAHYGGFLNVLMPAHWAISAGLGVAVGVARVRAGGLGTAALTAALMAGQLGWIHSRLDTAEVVPSAEERNAGAALVAELRTVCGDGPILAPHFAWVPVALGQAPSMHLISLWDINHAGGPYREEVQRIARAASAHRWRCVLKGGRTRIGYGVEGAYEVHSRVSAPAQKLRPQTGWRVWPTEILVPREDP